MLFAFDDDYCSGSQWYAVLHTVAFCDVTCYRHQTREIEKKNEINQRRRKAGGENGEKSKNNVGIRDRRYGGGIKSGVMAKKKVEATYSTMGKPAYDVK